MRIEQVYKQEQMKKKLVALEYIRLVSQWELFNAIRKETSAKF